MTSPSKEKGPDHLLRCVFNGFSTEIRSMPIKLINRCLKAAVMKNWHHLQIIVEETLGLSLVRVGFSSGVCFIPTGQSKPQRKQCIFFLWPDEPGEPVPVECGSYLLT